MTTQDWQREVARLMRETATLVEAGVVTVTQVDTEFELRTLRGLSGAQQSYNTGRSTVTLKLVGFSGDRWDAAAHRPGEASALPWSRLALGHD